MHSVYNDPQINEAEIGLIEQLQIWDLKSYLPNDILTKVDTMSMRNSLEVRAPLLNYNLVRYGLHLPPKYKVRKSIGKWIFRQLTYKYIPEKIMNRPKKGFAIPLADLLRGPLKNWGEDLLESYEDLDMQYFNINYVKDSFKSHCSHREDNSKELWNFFMFQSWYKKNIQG